MMNLRSVAALLAISAALSCATATYDGAVPGTSIPGAGSDSGGGAGLEEAGGALTAGAPAQQAGAPASTAGKGGAGKGGSGSGGAVGSAGAVGKAGSASGGTVGVSGSSGANMGGKAGTSSSVAGGSSTGGDGTAGAGTVGPCDNPKDLPGGTSGNTMNFGSLAAACFRTMGTFNTIGCSNFAGRTLKVNGALVMCTDGKTASAPFAAAIDGWTYFDVSAGTNTSASIYWYTS